MEIGEIRGKLIHCNGIVECVEPDEEGYKEENGIDFESFKNIFFKDYNLTYILELALEFGIHFHIATHTIRTNTCKEKAKITRLPLERVIKGFYVWDNKTEKVYGLVVPGDRTYVKSKVAEAVGINNDESETRIEKSEWLPEYIEYGTVHPFINTESFSPNGKLELILFDRNFLRKRNEEGGLDDFSFTTHPSTGYDNHRLSIQINYYDAFKILTSKFSERKVKGVDLF